MKTSTLCRITACALMTTMTIVGCTPGGRVRSASGNAPSEAKMAAQFAAMGVTAIRERNGAKAIALAERAVASQPKDARYRAQLGQSYLLAGRFASAIDAFRDAAVLAPGDGRVLLGMALADAALDRMTAARASVAAAKGRIAEPDRGLALALAGDGDAAIAILEPAARADDAGPKTRQNLALAYALSGRWAQARATAAQDLSPADLDARMAKWAQLAAPQARLDRVAAFLGVTPAAIDGGMPAQLALGAIPDGPVASTPVMVAAAEPAPEPERAAEPEQVASAAAAEPAVPMAADATNDAAVPVTLATAAVPPALLRAPAFVAPVLRTRPTLLMRAAYRMPQRGLWVVQLGAFASGRSIEAAWDKVRRTVRPVSGMAPLSSTVRTGGRLFQRLAVGGIGTRPEAVALCERVRGAGGVCFVRTVGDEAPVRMAGDPRPVRIAAR